jgi:phosphatidylglycerophosphate synthase
MTAVKMRKIQAQAVTAVFVTQSMTQPDFCSMARFGAERPWDARLARKLVLLLRVRSVTPNHLTTVRLGVGLASALAFLPGTFGWSNAGALLLAASNFLDHTDGELARLSGKTSRIGHIYDLVSDAAVTILVFVAIGFGFGARPPIHLEVPSVRLDVPPAALGIVAGGAIALIFFLRMRIEAMAGKAAVRQARVAGFEAEDVLYLMPLVTLVNGLAPLLLSAAVFAPLFAIWVTVGYVRARRRLQTTAHSA